MPYPVIFNGDHAEFERDHADMKPEDRPDWPLPSFDARDWARAFCKVAKRQGYDLDEGWMTTWFANALMRGFDETTSRALKSSLPAEKDNVMTEDQIKHLVDRFLQWRLPEDFNPDNGISYKRPNYAAEVDATPSGTNLFDAAQATDMVRFMVEGMPASSLPDETVSEAKVEAARDAFDAAYAAEYIGGVLGCRDNKDIALRAALEAALAPADDGWRPIQHAAQNMAPQMFDIGNGEFAHFNPGGRFHGWIFFRADDGNYVSVRQMIAATDFPASSKLFPAPPTDGRGNDHD